MEQHFLVSLPDFSDGLGAAVGAGASDSDTGRTSSSSATSSVFLVEPVGGVALTDSLSL